MRLSLQMQNRSGGYHFFNNIGVTQPAQSRERASGRLCSPPSGRLCSRLWAGCV